MNLATETQVSIVADTAPIGAALDRMAEAVGVIASSSAQAEDAQSDFLANVSKAGQVAGAVLALLAVYFVLVKGRVPGLQVNA